MTSPISRLISTLACALTLISCGGVGQDGTGATPPDSYNTGVVNGFGSVVVNGVHFDVRNATISIDGISGRRESDLRVGMVVAVTSRIAADGLTGVATRLVYESGLRGPIEAISSTTSTLQVLGQQVVVDDATVIAGGLSLSDLAVGNAIQVSGLHAHDGSLRATLIVRETASSDRQLAAVITGVAGNTVQMGGLSIDVGSAQLIDVTLATLTTGQLVRVDLVAPPVAGTGVATRLRLVDTRTGDGLAKQQRQGFVTLWNSGTGRFVLNGQTVQTTGTTEYQDGDITALVNGARVEVKGLRGTDGVLRAEKLRFLRSVLTAYGRGSVASVDAANQRFSLLNTAGVEVRVRAGTILNDNTGGTLNLQNLTVGQDVLVLGVANGNRIEAEVVTRLDGNPIGSGLAGPAQALTASGFTLLGVPVTTSGLTNFFDAQGNPLSATAFFSGLQQDDLIRAEGAYSAGTLTALNVRRVR